MNSTDKVFTEGLDMQKKFRDLEELQNYPYNICPTQYEESYILDTKQVLAEIVLINTSSTSPGILRRREGLRGYY